MIENVEYRSKVYAEAEKYIVEAIARLNDMSRRYAFGDNETEEIIGALYQIKSKFTIAQRKMKTLEADPTLKLPF